jgi:lambda family phage portal protein
MNALLKFDERYMAPPSPPVEQANADGLGRFGETWPTAYTGAGTDRQETYAWRPPFTSGESSTLYDRFLAGIRARDLARNDPTGAAIVMRIVDMVVGSCIRVSPRPDARRLGLDPKSPADRQEWTKLKQGLKREWAEFADNPQRQNDAQRRMTFNGQMRLMARTIATLGEATGYLDWRTDNSRHATCLRLVDPDRLSNPMGQPDTIKLRGGIEYSDRGEALAYHVRNGHPADWFRFAQLLKWTRIERCTSQGRPVFIHAFEPEREDQSRAITPFAALMTHLRMMTTHGGLELANAAANSLFAFFVHSNMTVADATSAMTPQGMTFADKRQKFYEKNPVFLNGVRAPIVEIGDDVKMNNSPRQTAAFEQFHSVFLRKVAAARGISYEQASMDFSKTNYSSVRAALNEVFRHVGVLFAIHTEQINDPIYYAVTEESFDRGYIEPPRVGKGFAPDFWEVPGAYLNSRWIGPGRGYVDQVKEAEGANIRMGSLTSTLERETGEQGEDLDEVLDQALWEAEELAARGLSRTVSAPGSTVDDPSDEAGKAEAGESANEAKAAADVAIAASAQTQWALEEMRAMLAEAGKT